MGSYDISYAFIEQDRLINDCSKWLSNEETNFFNIFDNIFIEFQSLFNSNQIKMEDGSVYLRDLDSYVGLKKDNCFNNETFINLFSELSNELKMDDIDINNVDINNIDINVEEFKNYGSSILGDKFSELFSLSLVIVMLKIFKNYFLSLSLDKIPNFIKIIEEEESKLVSELKKLYLKYNATNFALFFIPNKVNFGIINKLRDSKKNIESIDKKNLKDMGISSDVDIKKVLKDVKEFALDTKIFSLGKNLKEKERFLLFLQYKLIPEDLKDSSYNQFLNTDIVFSNHTLKSISNMYIEEKYILENILNVDYIRVNIPIYDAKIFQDANRGSWELYRYTKEQFFNNPSKVLIIKKDNLFARDPKADIVDGIIGIDFGTKSTVVVYSKNSEKILPMRVGIGDWTKPNKSYHYENPTVMEFNNLEEFLEDYDQIEFRPYTKWKDLTISHTAYENLQNSKSDDFNAYLTELKQWAGDNRRKIKIKSKKSNALFELKAFLDLDENDINPIEIYAYYLGLYINNQYNGIYTDYILSFPVTYDIEIRDQILESFKKGLKKSIPIDGIDLNINMGVSEPAAYASVALQEYGFGDKEKTFYAIFDFGGGTCDFDFGIFRFSDENNTEEKRYDYIIEHFGSGGDRYLGGENLLELLAFEVFKFNKDILQKNKIQFVLPPECNEFLGSEILLSNSREARLNMVSLVNILRNFWERDDFNKEVFKGQITVDLYSNEGSFISQIPLQVDEKQLYNVLYERIKKGVDAFFEALREVFANYATKIDINTNEINIFLAGNSSKSPIVKNLFVQRIKTEQQFMQENNIENKFNLFDPLGNKDDFEKPNGKTGVAYGLIETRVGGKILVVNKNINYEVNAKFKYYLGISRRKKFNVKVNREISYNKWIEFTYANVKNFEVYYTSSPLATTNNLSISDSAIKRKRLEIDIVDEDKSIYIKLISPTIFEYGVGVDGDIKEIAKVELNN